MVPRRIGAALLLLVPVLVHWPHLIGWLSENPAYIFSGLARGPHAGYPGYIDGNAGTTLQALGGLAARDWLRGVVPWWNPYSGIGLPLAAELQNGAFFLPFVLLLKLFDGVIYLKIVLQVLAGFACLGLLREMALGRLAAVTAAVCFELNGSFAWFGHGPILPIAFLPVLLFGIERVRRDAWGGALWIGIGIGWSLLAGFPETAYLDGLLALGWALVRVRGPSAWMAVAIGGLAGVAVAAPPLLAFVQSLPVSFLGPHADFHAAMLAPANRAPLVFPYVFGPPMYGGLRLRGAAGFDQYIHWFRTTAYLDLPLLALAVMAVRRDGLRLLLAGWLAVALARALGVPGVTALANAIPLVRNTAFHLYILPSCQMAATVLAACAIDDWQRGRLGRWRAGLGGGGVVAAACATLCWAGPEVAVLRPIGGYLYYPLLSVAGGVGAVAGVVWVLARPAAPGRRMVLAAGLVAQAAVLFALPLFGGTARPRTIDHAAMAFLARQPGLVRISAIGVLAPNYAAWFGIPAIDDNYLPVPENWVRDVRATLLPEMDGVNNFDPALNAAALRARLPALQAHGVTHLLLPVGDDPFAARFGLALAKAPAVPLRLTAPLSANLAGDIVPAGLVTGATLDIATYGGRARGGLTLRACQGDRCAEAAARLAGVRDNSGLNFRFATPLAIVAGRMVTYTVALAPGSAVAPAVWLWPAPGATAGETVQAGRAPRLTLVLAPPAGAPVRIYEDGQVAVDRLPAPAPYMQAPGCTLTGQTRLTVAADCPAAAVLVRRELSYPGWRLIRNGVRMPLGQAGIFQAARLPAGRSALRFEYAPPRSAYAWMAAAAGLLALAGCWAGRQALQQAGASATSPRLRGARSSIG